MKRGLSNLVAFIIVIMMTLIVAASFYYWFNSLNYASMSASETFTKDVQGQIITKSTSLVDQYYKTDREVNINIVNSNSHFILIIYLRKV